MDCCGKIVILSPIPIEGLFFMNVSSTTHTCSVVFRSSSIVDPAYPLLFPKYESDFNFPFEFV